MRHRATIDDLLIAATRADSFYYSSQNVKMRLSRKPGKFAKMTSCERPRRKIFIDSARHDKREITGTPRRRRQR